MEIKARNWGAIPFELMKSVREDGYRDASIELSRRHLELTEVHLYYFLLGGATAYQWRVEENAQQLIADFQELAVDEVEQGHELSVHAMRNALGPTLAFAELMPDILPGYTKLDGSEFSSVSDPERFVIEVGPVPEVNWCSLLKPVKEARQAFRYNCELDPGELTQALHNWFTDIDVGIFHDEGGTCEQLSQEQLSFIAYCMLHGADYVTSSALKTLKRMHIEGLAEEFTRAPLRALILSWDAYLPEAPFLPALSLRDLVGRVN